MSRWVALLRGVNVGRSNRLGMADLRATITSLGGTDVTTYLQSGNVLFEHAESDELEMAASIRRAVGRAHELDVAVIVRNAGDLRAIAGAHPDGETDVDPKYLHVVFFDRWPSAAAVAAMNSSRFTPDRFSVDGRHAFVTYPAGSARSTLSINVFERACGVVATARNLNTVQRLAGLVAP